MQLQPEEIIKRPILLTESDPPHGNENQVIFEVSTRANKIQIKAPSKPVSGRRHQGSYQHRARQNEAHGSWVRKTPKLEKAVVTLKGDTIQFYDEPNNHGHQKYKPTSPSRRFYSSSDYSDITKSTPSDSSMFRVDR